MEITVVSSVGAFLIISPDTNGQSITEEKRGREIERKERETLTVGTEQWTVSGVCSVFQHQRERQTEREREISKKRQRERERERDRQRHLQTESHEA